MKGRLLFEEVQTFKGTWKFYLIIGIAVATMFVTLFLFIQQVLDKPEKTTEVLFSVLFTWGSMAILLYIIFSARLEVKIDEGGLYYIFFPFIRSERSVKESEVKSIMVKRYRPLEYGGHGLGVRRLGRKRGYTIAGRQGIEILFKNKKSILLGTQRPAEAEKAVAQLKESWKLTEYG